MDTEEQKTKLKLYFIEKLGLPVDEDSLNNYIDECLSKSDMHALGSEYHNHHILPRSKFKEFENLKKFPWNSARLHSHEHGNVHLLLSYAYPIIEFIIPTHYFGSENKLLLTGTLMWDHMNSNPEILEKWKKKRSTYMKNIMKPGNPLYDGHIDRLMKRMSDPNERKKISDQFKELHLDPEYKKQASENAKNSRSNPITLEKWYESCSYIWESEEYRQKMRDKLTDINKNEEKRKDAGEKIKKLWEDPDFRKRSMDAREKGNKERKALGVKRSNSTKMKENWANPEFRERTLAKTKETKAKNEANKNK